MKTGTEGLCGAPYLPACVAEVQLVDVQRGGRVERRVQLKKQKKHIQYIF
jgi:hypothetical protein